MLEQGLEPARHLHAAGAEMANFRNSQADKIDPVRRPVAQAQPAVGVARSRYRSNRVVRPHLRIKLH